MAENDAVLPLSELIERARNFSVHTSAEEAIYVCRRLADALESQTEQPEDATEDDDAKIARLLDEASDAVAAWWTETSGYTDLQDAARRFLLDPRHERGGACMTEQAWRLSREQVEAMFYTYVSPNVKIGSAIDAALKNAGIEFDA